MTEFAHDLPTIHDVDELFVFNERLFDAKYELVDGRLHNMAGGSVDHATIGTNAAVALGSRLAGSPCRARGSDAMVVVDETKGLYPDVSVSCTPERGRHIAEPVILIEVTSPSSVGYDHGEKFALYRRLPSLRHYVVVEHGAVRVHIYTRLEVGWDPVTLEGHEAVLILATVGVGLPLAELYAGTELAA